MKKYSLFMFFVLFSGITSAVPLRYGFVVSETAKVYADSSLGSEVLETLEMTDYRLVAGGEQIDEFGYKYNFDSRGLIKILTSDNVWGWIDTDSLIVYTHHITYLSRKGDSYYKDPDTTAERKLISAQDDYWPVLDVEHKKEKYWLKAARNGKFYWFITDSLIFEPQDAYYDVATRIARSYRDRRTGKYINSDKEKAYKFAHKFQKSFNPDSITCVASYDGEVGNSYLGTGAFGYFMIYRIAKRHHDWDIATEALYDMEQKYPEQKFYRGKAGPFAYLELINLLSKDIKDVDRAIDVCKDTILKFPYVVLEAEESTLRLDIYTAEKILENLVDQDLLLFLENGDWLINIGENPAVKLLGYKAKAQYYAREHDWLRLEETVYKAISQYPDEYRFYYLSTKNYTCDVLDILFETLMKEHIYDRYFTLTEKWKTEFIQYPIGGYCAFKQAEMVDRTQGDISTVLGMYKNTIDMFNVDQSNTSSNRQLIGVVLAKARYNAILESVKAQFRIVSDSTIVFSGQGEDFPIVDVLYENDLVESIYTDINLLDYADNRSRRIRFAHFIKIKFNNDRIGWVEYDRVEKIDDNVIYENTNKRSWCMRNGDADNNLFFPGPDIISPTIFLNLGKLDMASVRFYDNNEDNVLDVFARGGNSGYNVLDGKSFQPIARVHNNRGIAPIIKNGILILQSHNNKRDRNKKLKAFDIKANKELWERNAGFQVVAIAYENKVYQVIMDANHFSTLECLDIQSGIELWKSEPHWFHCSGIGVNDVALVTVHSDSIRAYDPSEGIYLWGKQGNRWTGFPVMDDKNVFVSMTNKSLCSIDLNTGQENWVARGLWEGEINFSISPLVTFDKVIYSPTINTIVAIDKMSGKNVWTRQFENKIISMCASDNMLYVYVADENTRSISTKENLFGINCKTGNIVWGKHFSSRKEVIYQSGRLFIDTNNGVLVLSNDN